MTQFTVTIPATTANLGVGFDCLGAALSLYNQFQFTLVDTKTKLTITVEGLEADKVSRDESNLIYQSFLQLYQHIKQIPPNVKIDITLGVPLSRGLGSSATAILGGLLGANQLAGNPLSQSELMEMAIAIEGHPDNVVPALLGNCQLSVGQPNDWHISPIPWHPDIIPVVAIPNFELSTEAARSVLPSEYNRSDAIFNISRMGLLLRALATNNGEWLQIALEDKIHQPYRQSLIRGYDEVKSAAIAAGAYGLVISGAGPTLLALTSPDLVSTVVTAISEAWATMSVAVEVRSLLLDTAGAKIIYR